MPLAVTAGRDTLAALIAVAAVAVPVAEATIGVIASEALPAASFVTL